MGAPRTQEGPMRMRRRLALVMATAMLAVAVGAMAASADVDRYQGTTTEYEATYTYETVDYPQTFTMVFDEYTGMFSGPGNQPVWGATWTEGMIDGLLIHYTTEYLDSPKPAGAESYVVTVDDATFDPETGNFEGVWSDTGGAGGDVVGVAGESTPTDYKNHGQYVKGQMDKQAAAHSLIGMPIQSQKKNNK
jgi:hypothetical protein